MIYQSVLFAVLTVFQITNSLPVEEKITPIEMFDYCVKVITIGENDQKKTPVLLIHGLGGTYKSWDGVMELLAYQTRRKICAVDLRNHGDSPWNNRTDVKALAADVDLFLYTHGIEKVNIIGHSLGGKTALHYALTNPNRVNSIVVEDAPSNSVKKEFYTRIIKGFEVLREALTKIPDGATEAEAKDAIVNFLNTKLDEMGVTEKFTIDTISFLEFKLVGDKWTYKYNLDALLNAMRDFDSFWSKSTGVYEGPALFFYGDKSPLKVWEDKENIRELFPNVKFVAVEGSGHVIHGKFREFDDEVIKFLNEVN